ncbi:MAG: hypothetical protein NZL87_00850 [Thermomicrobium sp.]|nr:hypothetical protein [Thermomicrobium sp.]
MLEAIRSGTAGRSQGPDTELGVSARRVRLSTAGTGPAPAPVVALVEVTVERAADGRPVRLRGASALHGVTTWFAVDLTSGQATVQDARGWRWSGEVARAPLPLDALVAAAAAPDSPIARPAEASARQQRVALGPLQVAATRVTAPREETQELLVRVDDAELLAKIRATRAMVDWQALVLRWLAGSRRVP